MGTTVGWVIIASGDLTSKLEATVSGGPPCSKSHSAQEETELQSQDRRVKPGETG